MSDPVAAFQALDLRVGRVLRVEPNEKARKPAYKLWIDFGPLARSARAPSWWTSTGPRSWWAGWSSRP